MFNYLIISFIGLLSIVATVISSKGGLYDRRFKWYKIITTRGWIVVWCLSVILVLTIWQATSEKEEQDSKESALREQRRINDSTVAADIQKGVEKNSKKLFDDLSQALARQNLRLDTVTNTLEKLRDSEKTVIIKPPAVEPFLMIMNNGIKHTRLEDNRTRFNIAITCSQATAKKLDISFFMELLFTDGTVQPYGPDKIFSQENVPKDMAHEETVTLHNVKEIRTMNIGVWGTYTDSENSKVYRVKDVYAYNASTKQTAFLIKEFQEKFFVRNNLSNL
jgi:hypothetical protein